MSFKSVVFSAAFLFVASLCKAQEPRIVGNDRDKHGCIPSAGYQWSVVRNECVQPFTVGVRLDPKASNLDKGFVAYLVFKDGVEGDRAELYIPGVNGSVILNRVKGTGVWKNKKYVLKQVKGTYSLENVGKKLLYQGLGAK